MNDVDIEPYDIYSTLTVKDSIPAQHVKDISDLLVETVLDDDKPNRLTVSQPPRTAKSSLITLSFPFWLVYIKPDLNILIVNYSQTLADDFGMKLRQLFLDHKDFLARQNIYLSDKQRSKSYFMFENKEGELLGSIKLVGVGGAITGRDVDICIADDLIKGFSDCTPTLLDKLYSWFQNILVPRLEPHSKLILLGTRWAPISNECPVLTANRGWTTHGELKIGDSVYSPNGKPTKITKIHPKVQINNKFTFDTGETIICGNNHIWKVIYRNKEQLMSTSEIMSRKIIKGKKQRRPNYLINNHEPLQFSEKNLPINPYWLGLWLGDGHHKRPSITLHKDDKQSVESVPYKLIRYDVVHPDSTLEAFFTHQGLTKKLRELNIFGNKHVPTIYLKGSVQQRLELLAGLIDSDGYVEKTSNRVGFCNTNKKLVDAVIELCYSLGFKPKVSYRASEDINKYKKDNKIISKLGAWVVRFTPNIEIPTKLPRKKIKGINENMRLTLIEASKTDIVEGNCITVDSEDGMYLIGRSLIPTHNSNDIIGRLQEEQPDRYKFVNIKALKDDGTCIWPYRYTPDFFKERQEEVGERVFQAQYQGQPLDEQGAFFQLDNLLFDEFRYQDRSICVRSWDLAYSDESKGDINDYSASIKMWKSPEGLYWITDLKNGQYGENIHNELKRTAYLDTPNTPILIETGTKGGASKFYYNDLKNIYLKGYNVRQSEPVGSKVDRALAFRDAIWDGKIVIDLDENGREALIKQLNSFPLGKHDDIIDACSYAYNYLQDKKPIVKKLRAGKKQRVKL